MNWTIEYLKNKGYIRVNSEGKFNLEDHRRKMEEIFSKDYWRPDRNILFDCTKIDFLGINNESVRKFASNWVNENELIGGGKIAMLMKSAADFARGRQFDLLTENKKSADVRLFLNEKQALDWLEKKVGK